MIEPDCNNQANHLRERGREFYDQKYKSEFDNLFNSVGEWFKAMGQDPVRTYSFSLDVHLFIPVLSYLA